MVRAGGWGNAEAKEAKEAAVLEAVLRGKGDSPEPVTLAELEATLNGGRTREEARAMPGGELDAATIGFAVESLCLVGLLERVDDGAAVQATQGAARFWLLSDFMH